MLRLAAAAVRWLLDACAFGSIDHVSQPSIQIDCQRLVPFEGWGNQHIYFWAAPSIAPSADSCFNPSTALVAVSNVLDVVQCQR